MQGWRKRMEDSHISHLNIEKNIHLFGVFDGHGGKEVAQFVKIHFKEELIKNKNFLNKDYKIALIETFLKMDELVLESSGIEELKQLNKKSKEHDENQNKDDSLRNELYYSLLTKATNQENVALFTGCTATVCLLDNNENKAYFANAGDSRIVTSKKGVAYPMTIDHKPDMDSERNRIYKADGWVAEGRIKGNLNLSRSLGDMEYKQNKELKPEDQMITAFPDVVIEDNLNEVELIIIGCDGIWDCKSNQEAVDYFKENINTNSNDKISNSIGNLMDDICAVSLFGGKKAILNII